MNKHIIKLKTFLKGNTALRDAVRAVKAASGRNARKKTLAYLKKHYGDIIEKYNSAVDSVNAKTAFGGADYPVWVCWLQGEKNMPPIVKMCYRSLLKNAGGRKINLITFDNYRTFADIPDYIIEKHAKNIIHNTQLSDIIRVFLLCEHGGLWIDATHYVSGNLPAFGELPFWTPRWNNGCKKGWTSLSYMESLLYCGYTNNILMRFLKDIFVNYWKNEDKLIDYLLLSASIECAYNNIERIRNLIDAVPLEKRGYYDLYYSMNLPYNENEYKALCDAIRFHKLTYKENFKERAKAGELTFYGYLRQEYERGAEI